MRKIAVIGSGTAGILSICHMLTYLTDCVIYSINDPKIPSVGIGESTNPVFWHTLVKCLELKEKVLFDSGDLDATVKYGTLYKDWREEDFLNPFFGVGDHYAIHFNAYKLKDFVFNILRKKYNVRFIEIEGNVNSIEQSINSVNVNINNQSHIFEYVIDCRGFPKDKDKDYTILPMFLNRGFVHNVEGNFSFDHWGYTLHQATKDGWMFGVPLRNRISYGYLFNDQITNEVDAKENFSNILGVSVNSLDKIEFKFNSYYTKKLIDGRIIKNGNASVFFEPMFANSLWLYDNNNKLIYDYIVGNTNEDYSNYQFYIKIKTIRDLICFYYKGGSKFDGPFWEYAKSHSSSILEKSIVFEIVEEILQFMSISGNKIVDNPTPYSIDNLLKLDRWLGYNKWNDI